MPPRPLKGKAIPARHCFDYCDRRAREGYFAAPGSPERQAGQDFLWYLWCGRLSPIFGRSAMTTFERLYIARQIHPLPRSRTPITVISRALKPPTRSCGNLVWKGRAATSSTGHVPVRAIEGESPVKGGGKIIVIDGGFCRAYHQQDRHCGPIHWCTTAGA